MANKKYLFLEDHIFLREQLIVQQKSMARLAAELAAQYGEDKACIAGCLRWIVYRYFSKQERALMGKDRAFHRNKKADKSQESSGSTSDLPKI